MGYLEVSSGKERLIGTDGRSWKTSIIPLATTLPVRDIILSYLSSGSGFSTRRVHYQSSPIKIGHVGGWWVVSSLYNILPPVETVSNGRIRRKHIQSDQLSNQALHNLDPFSCYQTPLCRFSNLDWTLRRKNVSLSEMTHR